MHFDEGYPKTFAIKGYKSLALHAFIFHMLKIKVRQLGHGLNFFNFVFVLNVYYGGKINLLYGFPYFVKKYSVENFNNTFKIFENYILRILRIVKILKKIVLNGIKSFS